MIKNKNSVITQCAVLLISLMLMSAQAINGTIPYIKSYLGVTTTQTELLSTISNLAVLISILLSTFIASWLGTRRTVTIGLTMAGIGGCLPMFLSNYYLILGSRILLGAGCGLFNSLAVSIISTLYVDNKRASLLGIRNSLENIGQAVLTVIAGLLIMINWRYAFLIYLIAFPLIVIFNVFVPNIDTKKDQEFDNDTSKISSISQKEKLPFSVYLLIIFAVILVMNSFAVSVRFPSIATEIKGADFNTSNFLAMMPILGIIAGFFFGTVHKIFKTNTVIVGVLLLILVNVLIGFSNGNFTMLIAGVFLSGVPNAFCFPYIYNNLGANIKSKKALNLATALVLVGCNVGGFIAPFAMEIIQKLAGTQSLIAPFPVFASILAVIAIGIFINNIHLMRVESRNS